jgi:chemosensory pili system protein ChpC
MEKHVEELYSLLVPLHKNRLIVPRSCVAEVIRYALPANNSEENSWFRGYLDWNGTTVPVVCFEDLCGLSVSQTGGRTRIAVFHCMSGAIEGGFYGVLTEGFPQLVRVNRDVMQRNDQQVWSDDDPVICQIRMINEYPLIPDLEKLEELIAGMISQEQTIA